MADGAPNRMVAQEAVGLTPESEDDFERLIEDPSLIETHEQALEVIWSLDHQIAAIQAQLSRYRTEAANQEMPEDRQDWLRRATYACSMKQNDRWKVMQRDKEIRGILNAAQTKRDPAVGLAKQERLRAEAEARKAAKLAEHSKAQETIRAIAERQSKHRLFFNLARAALPRDQLDALMAQVRALTEAAGDGAANAASGTPRESVDG